MDFYVEYSLSPTHDLILPYWDYSLVQTGAFNSLDILALRVICSPAKQ